MKKAALFLVLLAAVALGQKMAPKTVTVKLFYPGSTPVESFVLPKNGDEVGKWLYWIDMGCIRYKMQPGDEFTTFCGTFKVTPNGGS